MKSKRIIKLMRKATSFTLILSVINLSFVGCSGDKSTGPGSYEPDSQGNVKGETDSNGTVTIKSKEFEKDIKLEITDTSGKNLSGIEVDYNETDQLMSAVISDPKGEYAPAVIIGNPSSFDIQKGVNYKIAYIEETEEFFTIAIIVLTVASVIWSAYDVIIRCISY